MHTSRRYLAGFLAHLAALASCIAFASSIRAAEDVHVGIVNSSTDASFFMADAKGYFAAEGLHVDLLNFPAAAKMVPALGTGELDAGGGAVSVALYNAVARGIDFKVVADKAHHPAGRGHAALLVRKALIDSGKFKDFKDLKGLKVALSGAGTSDESVLNEALKRGGLKWGDSEVVYMGFPQHPAAFVNGAIDAAITAEPSLTNTLKTGGAVVFSRVGQFYPDQQSAGVIYGANFIKSKPETAKKFIRAFIRGARFYNDAIIDDAFRGPNASEVISIMTKYSLTKDPNVYKVTIPPAVDPDGKLNVDSMRKDWQFFKDTRQIDGSVTVDQILDTSLVEQAMVSLGAYVPKNPK
jgi:NitT/TauT family transport system substrate-binding protein